MKNTINIVTEKGNWILKRMAEEVAKNGWVISDKTDPEARINYYINYALAVDTPPTEGLKAGYFTHIDPDYIDTWKKAEEICDMGIYMAEQYKPECKHTKKIYPTGLDYIGLNPKLKVGIAGRIYENGRKGEDWIKNLMKIDNTEWYALGDDSWEKLGEIKTGVWQSDEQARTFYEFIDVLICASKIEGGPVPIIEAIKCGTPVISTACGNYEEWSQNAVIVKDEMEMNVELQRMRDAKLERWALTNRDWGWFAEQHKLFFESYV